MECGVWNVEWSAKPMMNVECGMSWTIIPHSTFNIQHSTFIIGFADHSTINIQQSTFIIGSADQSTFIIQHST